MRRKVEEDKDKQLEPMRSRRKGKIWAWRRTGECRYAAPSRRLRRIGWQPGGRETWTCRCTISKTRTKEARVGAEEVPVQPPVTDKRPTRPLEQTHQQKLRQVTPNYSALLLLS